MNKPNKPIVPLTALLRLIQLLKKTILSKKFYSEVNLKILDKTSAVDANLYFLCYSTLLISSIFTNKPKILKYLQEKRISIIEGIEKQFGVEFNESNKWIARLKSRRLIKNEPSQYAQYFKNITSYLSDIRIFNRLTDSIKYMPWLISEYEALVSPTSSSPKLTRFIALLQPINCILLELFENAGWLTDHNFIGTSDNNYWCIETYIWSSRIWGIYILIEILELFRNIPINKWDKAWKINLFKQVVQLPMVLHWSLRDGCLTPFWVGMCGVGASWWGFKNTWQSLEL